MAGAFTPDWQVIEGFALEHGRLVGQDSFPTENDKLIYKGLVSIRNGIPFFTQLDSITDPLAFALKAAQSGWSVFMQVAPVIAGRRTNIDLPGVYKRRFLIHIQVNGESEYAIADFIKPMDFAEAVNLLENIEDDSTHIRDVVYLDMGAVSMGYVYDKTDERHLIGDPGQVMDNYTSLLVLTRASYDP